MEVDDKRILLLSVLTWIFYFFSFPTTATDNRVSSLIAFTLYLLRQHSLRNMYLFFHDSPLFVRGHPFYSLFRSPHFAIGAPLLHTIANYVSKHPNNSRPRATSWPPAVWRCFIFLAMGCKLSAMTKASLASPLGRPVN
ncbi:hypothetical protein GTNG_0278 [Geobacillus thermodenitrificans NG80-2]|uniref:Uncharacterized protein n=1 Tax=Geobacillus thermodenitrificans (strain NG80-2) TaxID=420246 RepID=A4IK08_GEOTN|nr:hypothetical protein GTNG_0278 [Geobacillus thermodenitrificans NG80-2]